MKLIFEHIIVNGYVIDVYGSVAKCLEGYYVSIEKLYITHNGYKVMNKSFLNDPILYNMFVEALYDTEEQYQQYLMDIYHGY